MACLQGQGEGTHGKGASMTRSYALKRLLEHGALTRPEIATITGWSENAVRSAIERLMEYRLIRRTKRQRRSVYEACL
jgi:transcription initiation factor IIE alpha subunit